MTFTDLCHQWLAWRNGRMSTGEFLCKLETHDFEVRACESLPLTPDQRATVRDWKADIATRVLTSRAIITVPDLNALPGA